MKSPTYSAREWRNQSSADREAPVVTSFRWRAYRLGLLCGLAVLASAPALAVESAAVPDAAAIAPAVTVVPAESREIVERAIVTGTLVPRDEILVSPEVEGLRITELLVEEGDRVTKGQVLARLSLEMLATQEASNAAAIARAQAAIVQAQSQIVQAEAANVEAKQALERAQSLAKTGNATAAVLEQRVSAAQGAEGRLAAAKGGVQSAQADLATARAAGSEIALRRARADIRAPEAGVVNRRTARNRRHRHGSRRAPVPADCPRRDRTGGRGA